MELTEKQKKILNSGVYDDEMKYLLISFEAEEWEELADNKDINNYELLDKLRDIFWNLVQYKDSDSIFRIDMTETFIENPHDIINDFVPYATYKVLSDPHFDEMMDGFSFYDTDYICIVQDMVMRARNQLRLLGDKEVRRYARKANPRIITSDDIYASSGPEPDFSDQEFSIFMNICNDIDSMYFKRTRIIAERDKLQKEVDKFIGLNKKERMLYLYNLSDEEFALFRKGFGDEGCMYIDELLKKEVENTNPLQDTARKYDELKNNLLKYVKGQDRAVEQLIGGLFRAEIQNTKAEDNRPYATFFFFGPPGTGKTFTASMLAKLLKYPYRIFNMAEYAHEKDEITLIGTDRTWHNSKEGELFSFRRRCEDKKFILIFDEIEKSNQTVKHAMLSLLGSGKLDNLFSGEEVSFENAILIFTSNIGRRLYEDFSINTNSIPFNKIRQAFEEEKDYRGLTKLSPEFVSRIGSDNVVLFNSLSVNGMKDIVTNRLEDFALKLMDNYGCNLSYSSVFPYLMLYREIRADARVMAASSEKFVKSEIYELASLLNSGYYGSIDSIYFDADIENMDISIRSLFIKESKERILYIGDRELDIDVKKISDENDLTEALKKSYDYVLADPFYGGSNDKTLSITDYNSRGIKLFYRLKELDDKAYVFIVLDKDDDISKADRDSMIHDGASGFVYYNKLEELKELSGRLYLNKMANELRQKGFVLDFKTKQLIDGNKATIMIYDCKKYRSLDLDSEELMLDEKNIPDTRFDDVIGCTSAKNELTYFVKYLKNPIEFMQKGLKTPRGVLLYGPPGTGKTMLARAAAGESQVNFISLTGSDLLTKSWLISQTFESARRYSPTIIFIDELDAIGKARNGSDRDALLNMILTQMDGFNKDTKHPIFVLAATNFKLDSLDGALLRRFDSKIFVDVPDQEDRARYVHNFIQRRKLNNIGSEAENLFVKRTVGLSLAEVENILEFSVRCAFLKETEVNDEILIEAYDEYYAGSAKKKSEEAYKRTSIHEAGHAIASHFEGYTPDFITIVSRAEYGGYVLSSSDNSSLLSGKEVDSKIKIALSGRAAEEIFYGSDDINMGISSDMDKASALALMMVNNLSNEQFYVAREKSEEEKYKLNCRANELLKIKYEEVLSLLNDKKEMIEKLSEILMKKNHLTKEEFLTSIGA